MLMIINSLFLKGLDFVKGDDGAFPEIPDAFRCLDAIRKTGCCASLLSSSYCGSHACYLSRPFFCLPSVLPACRPYIKVGRKDFKEGRKEGCQGRKEGYLGRKTGH